MSDRSDDHLAIAGGRPVRETLLPYGCQSIDAADLQAVLDVLRSDWLTTGPRVAEFEQAFATWVGASHAVAVNSGTAALHAAMYASGVGVGTEVIVPAMTFVATANAVVMQGGTPVLVDVDAGTLLVDLEKVREKITVRTRAIVAVDYAGHPCDYDGLRVIADEHGLALISDACHAVGGSYRGRPVGALADLNCFSFHPVKHLTTGEGGMITTNDGDLAGRMRLFRNHGITSDHRQRSEAGSWYYEMADLGYNYRLTDFQCALGESQLGRLAGWVGRRREIASRYGAAFDGIEAVRPLEVRSDVDHAYHLYVVRLETERLATDRGEIFRALRAEGIGVNVHYVPVHLHPYYRNNHGTAPGLCPIAEAAYEQILSLPMFPTMTDDDIGDVVAAVRKVLGAYLTAA